MNDRCKEILKKLKEATEPVTASKLADMMSVSRQVIVGDVSLMRASGYEIVATSRGYIINDSQKAPDFPFTGIIACKHTNKQMKDELYTIVDFGATVIDVSIEHAVYGELSGKLDLASRYDVDQFIKVVNEEKNSTPISVLTGGIHLHRIGCRSSEMFERIKKSLTEQGIAIS